MGHPSASTVVGATGARSARSSERIINQTNIASRRVYIVDTTTHKYDIYSTFDGPVLVSRRLKVWLKVPIIFEPRVHASNNLAKQAAEPRPRARTWFRGLFG